jgi:hypothetical protein
VTTIPPPLLPPHVEAPDRDYAAARDAALAVVTATAGTTWTDHNAPDPGVTLLEALAWGVADLHYRTARRDLGTWPLEVPSAAGPAEQHWSGVPLAEDPAQLLELAAALAAPVAGGRSLAAHLAEVIAGATSALDATRAITTDAQAVAAFGAGGPPTWVQAAGAVRLLRGPVVLRGALDGAALVADALREAGGDENDAVAILRLDTTVFAELWEDELRGLVRRERRRATAERVQALADTIAAADDTAVLLTQLTTTYGLSAAEASIALALHPCPAGVLAEEWEQTGGATRVWPPHPVQARTCEPVTLDDYARRARDVAGITRAWAVAGMVLPGLSWDGRVVTATETRAGAITLLVQPDQPPANAATFLRNVLRVALGDPDPAGVAPEVDDAFQGLWRDELDSQAPRRTICDEVGAALLGECPITIKGILHAPAGSDRDAVIGRARDRVDTFFTEGRPESRPPEPGAPDCPGGIAGTWPAVAQPSLGWTPGDAIRLSELVEQLADDPEVLGIEGLQVAIGDGEWLPDPGITGHVPLPPDCVPKLSNRKCLRVTLARQTECAGG